MRTIILNYDNYNVLAQRALDNILSLGYFKAQTIEKPQEKSWIEENDSEFLYSVSEQALAKDWLNKEEVWDKPLFAESFGMWADRDIDIKKLRKGIYEKRTKHYNNATL